MSIGAGHDKRLKDNWKRVACCFCKHTKLFLVAKMYQNLRKISHSQCKSLWMGAWLRTLWEHRFSAFWLRSKCSICSYQLNIWYVDHVSTSILIWFFQGEWLSEACFGSFTSWPGIAVPPGSAHFPIIQPIKAIQTKGKQTAEARGRSWTIVCCLVPVCKGLVHLADTRGLHRAGKENVGQWGLFSNRRVDPSPTNCGLNFSPYLTREWFWGQKLCSIMIWEAKAEESVVCSKAMYLRVCHGGPKKTDDKHTYLA